jgi:hypothetical protein
MGSSPQQCAGRAGSITSSPWRRPLAALGVPLCSLCQGHRSLERCLHVRKGSYRGSYLNISHLAVAVDNDCGAGEEDEVIAENAGRSAEGAPLHSLLLLDKAIMSVNTTAFVARRTILAIMRTHHCQVKEDLRYFLREQPSTAILSRRTNRRHRKTSLLFSRYGVKDRERTCVNDS